MPPKGPFKTPFNENVYTLFHAYGDKQGLLQKDVVKIVADRTGYSPSTVARWKREGLPQQERRLDVCVVFGYMARETWDEPDCREWIRSLFHSAVPERSDAKEFVEEGLTEIYGSDDFRETYCRYVRALSALMPLVSNPSGKGDIDAAYVQTRLVRRQQDDNQVETVEAHNVLRLAPVHAVISAPPGAGKTTLWRYLIRHALVESTSAGVPIPLDLRQIGSSDIGDPGALVRRAVAWLCENAVSEHVLETFVEQLVDQLESGSAVFLVDNWDAVTHLVPHETRNICRILRSWQRVLLLGRPTTVPTDVHFTHYDMPPLTDNEIRHFVRRWPRVTGRPTQQRAVVQAVRRADSVESLLRRPLFLDLICDAAAAESVPAQTSPLRLVRWIVDRLIRDATADDSTSFAYHDLRYALSEVANLEYRRTQRNLPMRQVVPLDEVIGCWTPRVSSERAKDMLAMAKGARVLQLVHITESERGVSFPHPRIRAVLAAYALARQPGTESHWLDATCANAGQPAWKALIRALVMVKDERGERDDVAAFLRRLVRPQPKNRLADAHAVLLAGHCLAELSEATREYLEAEGAGVGAQIRRRLLEQFREPVCEEHFSDLRDLLPRVRTKALVDALVQLARDPRSRNTVRVESLRILGQLEACSAVEELGAMAHDRSEPRHIRWHAVEALGATHDSDAVQQLASLLADEDLRDDVIDALVSIGSLEAFAALCSDVDSDVEPPRDDDISGTDANDVFRRCLAHSGREVAEHAATILARKRTLPACDALLAVATDSECSADRRMLALRSLPDDCGQRHVDRLLRLVVPADGEERRPSGLGFEAIRALLRIKKPAVAVQLGTALRDADEVTAMALTQLVAERPVYQAAWTLMELLEEEAPRLRREALYALAMIFDAHPAGAEIEQYRSRAIEAAVDELDALGPDEESDVARLCESIGILAQGTGNSTAIEALYQVARTGLRPAAEALKAISAVGGPEAEQALVHYAPCEGGITLHAAWVEGLIRLGTEESITIALVVFETMRVVWGDVGTTPLKRLSSIRRPAAAEVLLRYGRTSNDIDVAQYSARALGQIGYEPAVPALLAWAEEQFHVVQEILRDWPAPMVAPQTRTEVLAAVNAQEEPVRHAALLCLQHFDPVLVTPGILEEVERLIVDEETGTGLWYAAIEVLSTLDEHRTVSLLCTILTRSRLPRNCRIRLVRTLAAIGDPAAIPVVLETASDERRSRLRLRRLYRARAQYLSAWLKLGDAYADIRNAVFYRYRYRGSGDVLHIREDGRVTLANGQTMPAWRAKQRLCRLGGER